jgi:hypothetical protein
VLDHCGLDQPVLIPLRVINDEYRHRIWNPSYQDANTEHPPVKAVSRCGTSGSDRKTLVAVLVFVHRERLRA